MTAKFWIGGTGTWDNTGDTHWSLSSGGPNNTTHAISTDTVTFDGASGGGTVTVNATITVQSITCGAFTGTLDFSANNNNVTLSASGAFNGSGTGTRTINLGNGTWTLSTTSLGVTNVWQMSTTTGLTFNANSSTIDFTGTVAAGAGQSFQGGGLTYSTVKVSGARYNSGLLINNAAGTIATLTNTAAASITLTGSQTITTLTQSAQLALSVANTITFTNAPTLTGTSSAPLCMLNGATGATAGTATISCASGTFGGSWLAIQGVTFSGGATFSFTSSFDNGKNTGATITAPSASSGMLFIPDLAGT